MDAHNSLYPDAPDVDGYINGNQNAIYVQVIHVERMFPERIREFLVTAARSVASRFCEHGEQAPRILEGNTLEARAISKAAHGGHRGLCGKHQAHIIAGVRTDVVMSKHGAPIANKFRNEVSRFEDE